MSRQSQLPPRCPFQTKNTTFISHNSISRSSSNEHFTPRLQKTVSQSYALEEEPPWLDNILSETDDIKVSPLRRSVSDPVTVSDGLVSVKSLGSNESGSGLEASCVYGPNSPRSRGSIDLSENIAVSRLTDYFSRTPTLYAHSGLIDPGMIASNRVREVANVDTGSMKRHSGQRSRVRKLQYIAELEKTVEGLQSLQSEIAMKVASLLQLRMALSIENNALQQQLASFGQKKLFLEGQYRSLKMELDGLKIRAAEREYNAGSASSLNEEPSMEAVWEMINIGKLNLNQ